MLVDGQAGPCMGGAWHWCMALMAGPAGPCMGGAWHWCMAWCLGVVVVVVVVMLDDVVWGLDNCMCIKEC